MWAISDAARAAISRTTVRMVPSAGSRTDAVRAVGGARHGGGDQDRVHELARAGDELLRGAADELAQDDAAVSARAEQRRASDGVDDLVATDLVDLALGGEIVEFGENGTKGQRHVVSRIAIGDREDVQVVDLMPPRFEVRERSLDDEAETEEARIGHDGARPPVRPS